MTLKEALISYENLLVDFYSEDCPPCHIMEEELRKLQVEEAGLTYVLQVDKSMNPEVFEAFKVKNLPHLKFFRKGRPLWNFTGILRAEEIVKRIKKA